MRNQFLKIRGNQIFKVDTKGVVGQKVFDGSSNNQLSLSRIAYTNDGKLYVLGGATDQEYSEVYNSCIQINIENGQQELIPSMRIPRCEFGVAMS